MAFSKWAAGFGQEFGKWGVSASEASARAMGVPYRGPGQTGGYTRTIQRQPTAQRYVAPTGGGVNAATLAAIQRAKAQYAPGGGFGRGVEAGLERGRVKTLAAGMQSLVGAGLAGTTMAAGLGKRYEEEVAAPTRLSVEEQRAQAISGIEMAQAGMGFQAGQAGAQRSLQMYLAQLRADLQREEMARRDQPMAVTPQVGGYARQFPSLYDTTETQVPNWMGSGGGGIDWEQKRLADEAQAQRLKTAGRLTFDPEELESTWRSW